MAVSRRMHRQIIITIIYISVFAFAKCSQEFIITHSPQYVSFLQTAGSIPTSQISKVIALGLGFSPRSDLQWSGLAQGSVFHKPKANVLITIEGFTDGAMKLDVNNVAHFKTTGDVPVPDTDSVVNQIQSSTFNLEPLIVDFSADNTVFDLRSHYPRLFSKLPATIADARAVLGGDGSVVNSARILNASNDADLLFLTELELVQQIVKSLQKNPAMVKDASPDLFNLKLAGLRKVVEQYGSKSTQTEEALSLLTAFVKKVTEDFKQLYGGHVMIEVVTLSGVEEAFIRKTRSLMADAPAPAPSQSFQQKVNVAADYDEDYPAIFNIILWTMVLLILALFAISYGTWFMDPGRDSIIYRMTSQRLKKD